MHNYAHVWYISEQIFDNAKLPLHVALLDSGQAVTFPYAIGPYLLGAILFPLLGNWAVTLLMVVAILGIVYGAGLARPVMRDPWFILLFVLNPFFIDAIFGFQFASLWSAFFFFLFVWAFEKRRYLVAGALAWLAVSSHPVLGAEALGVFGLCLLLFARPRVRPLIVLGVPVAIALVPIYWMTLHTPAAGETSTGTLLYDVVDAFVRRGTIIAFPFALSAGAPYVRRFYPALMPLVAAGFAVAMVFQSGVYRYPGAPSGYYGMIHRSSDMYAEFFRSPSFQPGGTYRLLEPGEREDGMYRFMQHGAVLSNEFFTESLHHQSWSEPQYQCYGAFKRIDFVVVERAYDRRAGSGERDLLDSLIAKGLAQRYYSDAKGRFDVYDIRLFVSQRQQPKSLRECGMA